MSPPIKDLEQLLLAKKIKHGGNPMLKWQSQNVVLTFDSFGNVLIDKKKSKSRVDGMVALTMALKRAIVTAKERTSVYDDPKRVERMIGGKFWDEHD